MSEESARIDTIRCDDDSLSGIVLKHMLANKLKVIDLRDVPVPEGVSQDRLLRTHPTRLRNLVANKILTHQGSFVYELSSAAEIDPDVFPGVVCVYLHVGEDVFSKPVAHVWRSASECPPIKKVGPASIWDLAGVAA